MASRREDLGSWLEGTPGSGTGPESSALGLPAAGPGSRAGVGRRLAALGVDWALSMAVASLLWTEAGRSGVLAADPWATLAVFAGSSAVFVGLLGHTFGHRLLGLRVVRLAEQNGRRGPVPGPPGLLAGTVRTGLLALVIPAVVWDGTGRGLHDVAASTAIVRR